MTTRLLYQFPISHFCEKSRWNLDYKGLAYTLRNLLPGLHRASAQRLAGVSTLPILCDGGRRIADSTAIALYLEEVCPEPRLLPADPAAREQVLALVHGTDALGEDIRLWIYSHLIDWPTFGRLFFASYPLPERWAGYAMTPLLRRVLAQVYRINPDSAVQSRQRLLDGLAVLEANLQHDASRYLVGDHFSLADLTAAALFAPLLGPVGSPWASGQPQPIELWALRQELDGRVAGQWLRRIYATHRATRPQTPPTRP